METNTSPSLLDRFNAWIKESIMLKLASIGFLILILLIPNSWISDLMLERQLRANDAIVEVSKKWSQSQTLSGPILVIPYTRIDEVKLASGEVEKRLVKENAYFLPEELKINGKIDPEILHRGIFDVAVYKSDLDITSTFTRPDIHSLGLDESQMKWNESSIIVGISDLRGISESPVIKVGFTNLDGEPSNRIGVSIQKYSTEINEYTGEPYENNSSTENGIKVRLNWASPEDFESDVSLHLTIKGSDKLSFVPTGKTTAVQLSGAWNNPSFDGAFLPEDRDITESGFTANWNVLHYNRALDQSWKDASQSITSAFGVTLLIPVDQYQKSIRTSKYSILIILLTFVSLFLVEIINKIRIHPFQYILIGAALIIYYTLLISLSEHTGYTLAYWIATLLTVSLLGFYAKSFLSNRFTLLFTSIISVIYLFIFVIIIQQDFSLLIGSLGLFIIIGLIMYFSRKVNWYKEG